MRLGPRAFAVLAAALQHASVATAADPTAAAASCAHVDEAEKQVWAETGGGKFNFHVVVGSWTPYESITMQFASAVTLDAVYEAKVAHDPLDRADRTSFTVELGPTPNTDSTFVVMGSGTLASNPRFECHGIKAPPPAPTNIY